MLRDLILQVAGSNELPERTGDQAILLPKQGNSSKAIDIIWGPLKGTFCRQMVLFGHGFVFFSPLLPGNLNFYRSVKMPANEYDLQQVLSP